MSPSLRAATHSRCSSMNSLNADSSSLTIIPHLTAQAVSLSRSSLHPCQTISRALAEERRNLQRILEKTIMILSSAITGSGVYSLKIPTIFITHQIHYHFPLLFWPIELSSILANYFLFENFSRVIVPDNPPGATSIAGKLSRPVRGLTDSKVFFQEFSQAPQKWMLNRILTASS
ncbi:MAG: hypothetical protein MZV49_19800 [Rhodopseudomonas palustris]|nr:hypothetical protein [Rhodopseudomonas palustris]